MRKQFNTLDFGPIIPMGPSDYGKAPEFPRPGEHPRLMFTKDMLPNIRKALDDPRLANAKAEVACFCATIRKICDFSWRTVGSQRAFGPLAPFFRPFLGRAKKGHKTAQISAR